MTGTNANTLPETLDLAEVDTIVARHGTARRALIPILQAIQNVHSYLPPEALQRVAETTQSSPADVTSVATFYTQFRTEPAGRHTIRVCIGTACHVKGAQNVFDSFKKHLGIPEDQDTDSDRTFTVEKVACLGCCMLAPAVQIDDLTYGNLSPAKVPGVLRDFLESLAREGLAAGAREIDGPPVGEVRMCLCSSCIASGASSMSLVIASAPSARTKSHGSLPAGIVATRT